MRNLLVDLLLSDAQRTNSCKFTSSGKSKEAEAASRPQHDIVRVRKIQGLAYKGQKVGSHWLTLRRITTLVLLNPW